jgi:FkbH-like protein
VAIEAFRRHPEMIITENDIAVFVANWNDKASNIEYIARVLNLGLDSFIFIDDSPFERDLVRTALPSVLVPDMPEDPADFVRAIEESGLLESSGFSHEDATRNQNYRIEAQRATEQIKYGSIDDYLASLGMQADCGPFRKEDLPRVAQLLQRSNQFNLRTQRFSEADCERYMLETDKRIGLQIKLADKFGDYGLISVVCCDVEDGALVVSELVMSCRVLKRGVEDYIMNRLFEECGARGLDGVRGEYRPTAKNGMVRSFFEGFGFLAQAHDAVREQWYLPADRYESRPTFIGTMKDE